MEFLWIFLQAFFPMITFLFGIFVGWSACSDLNRIIDKHTNRLLHDDIFDKALVKSINKHVNLDNRDEIQINPDYMSHLEKDGTFFKKKGK